jgi:hypothetical protein
MYTEYTWLYIIYIYALQQECKIQGSLKNNTLFDRVNHLRFGCYQSVYHWVVIDKVIRFCWVDHVEVFTPLLNQFLRGRKPFYLTEQEFYLVEGTREMRREKLSDYINRESKENAWWWLCLENLTN